jgi:hypothetical protein
MRPKHSLWRSIAGVCLLIATVVCCAALAANLANGAERDEKGQEPREQQQREQLLTQMRELAQKTQVRYRQGEREPQLVASPVFRYDDKPRHFLDATLWVWTDGGRPVAFEKIEAIDSQIPTWQHCFTSASQELLKVEWEGGRRYQTTSPGVDFRPLAEAPAVASSAVQRKRQARELVREFSARIVTDLAGNQSEAMRLLPRAIFEYSGPGSQEFLGAVFGLTTSGTNPDVLLLLEPRGEGEPLHWSYAVARMTAGGVRLQYRGAPVWEVDFIERGKVFPTWTFFSLLGNEAADVAVSPKDVRTPRKGD